MEEKFEIANGVPLCYTKVGSGPHNVLLIPGAIGSYKTDFADVLTQFDQKTFTLVGVDPPGYGKSGPLTKDLDDGYQERDAEKYHSLMKRLDLLPYAVLGWADGGLTALHLAHQHRFTKLVNAVVVWGVPLTVDDKLQKIYQVLKKIPEQVKKRYEKMYGESRLDDLWTQHIEAKIKAFKSESETSREDLLKAICCRTLVIHGDTDVMVPKYQDELIYETVPQSKFLTCLGAGHDLHIKQPTWFRQEVESFLTEIL